MGVIGTVRRPGCGLWCWGYNLLGQVGSGLLTNQTSPVQVTLANPVRLVGSTLAGYEQLVLSG